MKQRPILIASIAFTIIVELIIIILVYNKIGTERFPSQITRLTVQLILILWVLKGRSNLALFILTAYHIIMGMFGLYSKSSSELLGQILIGFHLIVALTIYFHDWIENKIGVKNVG